MIALRRAVPAQLGLLQELASAAAITSHAPAVVAAAAAGSGGAAAEPLCQPSTSGRPQGPWPAPSSAAAWGQRRQLFDFASGGDLSKKYDERKLIG